MPISRYIAVGKDAKSLEWLTEHLPYPFVPVTTPALLAAQWEEAPDAFFLVDSQAAPECQKRLANHPRSLWLTSGTATPVEGKALAKPMRLIDLLHAIAQAVSDTSEITLGSTCRFFPERRYLRGKGKEVALTERESSLLAYLAARCGQIVLRDELFKNIWGFSADLDTHTLETHIYRLRGKLAETGEDSALIETVEGGYKLA